MILEVASDVTQLALHALALVPIAGPGNLHDPAYTRWAEEHLPTEAIDPITRDAPLISAHADAALQWVPELFRDIAQLQASAAIDELRPSDVHRQDALWAWRSASPAGELLRAAMGLAALAFRDAWPRDRCAEAADRHRGIFERAARLHPALGRARVELAWPLGARGRAFPSRVIVGVPEDWTGLAPETPAVLALHEAAVRERAGGYTVVEWGALCEVASRVADADEALRDAHRAWLATLSLEALVAGALERGLCDDATAIALLDAPEDRAERFARSHPVPRGY